MPKGDRYALKADPEDGTTPVSNLLLEAVAMAKLSGLQKGAILYLWRETYGWADGEGKRHKEAAITVNQWASALNTDKGSASRAIAGLLHFNVIKRRREGGRFIYSLNTRIDQWANGCIDKDALRKKIEGCQMATSCQTATPQGLSNGNPVSFEGGCQKPNPRVVKNPTFPATNLATPKESIKESKERDQEITVKGGEIIGAVDFWDNCLEVLKGRLSSANFNTWLGHTKGLGFQGDTFILEVPSDFVAEEIRKRMDPLIRKTLSEAVGRRMELICEVQAVG